MEVVKDSLLLLVISWMEVVTRVKGSGLPGRHVQVYLLMTFRIQGIQRRGDGKDCTPLSPKERPVRWACLAIFCLDLGLGEVFVGTPGTCLRREQAVSALALTHLNWFLHASRPPHHPTTTTTTTPPHPTPPTSTTPPPHPTPPHPTHHHHHSSLPPSSLPPSLPRGQDFWGLFAQHGKPDGIRIKIPIALC